MDTWVVPGASRTGLAGWHDGALRVRVSVPAEGGRANQAAARLVARALGGKSGDVLAGSASRRKRILVRGVTREAAEERLRELSARPPATR